MKRIVALMLIVVILLSACKSIIDNQGNDNIPNSWVGDYSFFEYSPPDSFMSYSISICEEEGLYSYISIDGWMTLERLRAKILSDNNNIYFEFDDYYIDEESAYNSYEIYEKGDILLGFEKIDDNIITIWGKIQPMIIENKISGQYFIQKTD